MFWDSPCFAQVMEQQSEGSVAPKPTRNWGSPYCRVLLTAGDEDAVGSLLWRGFGRGCSPCLLV